MWALIYWSSLVKCMVKVKSVFINKKVKSKLTELSQASWGIYKHSHHLKKKLCFIKFKQLSIFFNYKHSKI